MREHRRSIRKVVSLEAEITAGTNSYMGHIENISTDGLYILFSTDPKTSENDFLPASRVTVKFELPAGEAVELECESKWINRFPESSHNMINQLGIQVINSPATLEEFIDRLP